MKLKYILEAVSSWNKVFRKHEIHGDRYGYEMPEYKREKYKLDYTKIDDVPEELEPLLRRYGAVKDSGIWWIKGSIPWELKNEINNYKRRRKNENKRYRKIR